MAKEQIQWALAGMTCAGCAHSAHGIAEGTLGMENDFDISLDTTERTSAANVTRMMSRSSMCATFLGNAGFCGAGADGDKASNETHRHVFLRQDSRHCQPLLQP